MKPNNFFKKPSRSIVRRILIFTVIAFTISVFTIYLCTSLSPRKKECKDRIYENGLLLNDNLVAIEQKDNTYTIKNSITGEITSENIQFDWTQLSPNDSLGVFCSNGKRGYYNSYTGKIAIPAQYRRAWVFSEGLAGVQKDGKIGFLDSRGNVVIDFRFPYHGNPLSEFIFKNGHCIVADTLGMCGVINRKGQWIIKPEYDDIETFKEYAIVRKSGLRMQVDYNGKVLNAFILDDLNELTYTKQERITNKDGDVSYINREIPTDRFAYHVGGRCGLMDNNCQRLTEPLYANIEAINGNMFRATLPDYTSIVILNNKGQLIQ
ncbi:MAG: WG repeat-containing protein [Bacteroidales bacterium]|nr:WG repeat-containing protein [Bacteroidales bacterium]